MAVESPLVSFDWYYRRVTVTADTIGGPDLEHERSGSDVFVDTVSMRELSLFADEWVEVVLVGEHIDLGFDEQVEMNLSMS